MVFGFKQARLAHEQFVLFLLRRNLRNLRAKLKAIVQNRRHSEFFCDKAFDGQFLELLALCGSNLNSVEAELLRGCIPPAVGEKVSWSHSFWAEVLYVVIELGHVLPSESSTLLIRRCLTQATPIGFALGHSTVIAALAAQHIESMDSALIEIAISSTDDSRAIYALKAARWLPNWSMIGPLVFAAMLSGPVPKRIEAMWLINERSTSSEALSFADDQGIMIHSSAREVGDIRAISRLILENRLDRASNRIDYGIRMDGSELSDGELKDLSGLIRKTLGE
jgi:hypothetical protein